MVESLKLILFSKIIRSKRFQQYGTCKPSKLRTWLLFSVLASEGMKIVRRRVGE